MLKKLEQVESEIEKENEEIQNRLNRVVALKDDKKYIVEYLIKECKDNIKNSYNALKESYNLHMKTVKNHKQDIKSFKKRK